MEEDGEYVEGLEEVGESSEGEFDEESEEEWDDESDDEFDDDSDEFNDEFNDESDDESEAEFDHFRRQSEAESFVDSQCAKLQKGDPSLTTILLSRTLNDALRDGVGAAFWKLGVAMIGNNQLKTLKVNLRCALTRPSTHTFAYGIGQCGLRKLILSGPAPVVSRHFQNILYQGIQLSKTIRSITLTNIPVDDLEGFSDALTVMPSLKSLKVLGGHQWNLQYLFSDVLTRKSSLTSLKLSGTRIADDGVIPMAPGMHHPPLQILKIEACKIGDEFVRLLVAHFLPTSPLESLSLPSNKIGPVGAQLLFLSVANHKTMRHLDLKENRKVGFAGLWLIGELLEKVVDIRLTDVDLSLCAVTKVYNTFDFDDQDVPAWVLARVLAWAQGMASEHAGRALIDGIKHNVHIKDLAINTAQSVALPFEVTNEIDFYADLNRFGRYLLSTDHELAASIWCIILAKCHQQDSDTPSLINFFLGEQPELVHRTRRRRWGNI